MAIVSLLLNSFFFLLYCTYSYIFVYLYMYSLIFLNKQKLMKLPFFQNALFNTKIFMINSWNHYCTSINHKIKNSYTSYHISHFRFHYANHLYILYNFFEMIVPSISNFPFFWRSKISFKYYRKMNNLICEKFLSNWRFINLTCLSLDHVFFLLSNICEL